MIEKIYVGRREHSEISTYRIGFDAKTTSIHTIMLPLMISRFGRMNLLKIVRQVGGTGLGENDYAQRDVGTAEMAMSCLAWTIGSGQNEHGVRKNSGLCSRRCMHYNARGHSNWAYVLRPMMLSDGTDGANVITAG